MRHRVQKTQMNRDTDHRKALLRNLCTSMIESGKIETTLAKAKFVKPLVEKTVTKAKKGTSFTNIKNIRAIVTTKNAEKKLFTDVVPMFKERQSGYTRIVKLGFRVGDNAEMARLEWVESKDAKSAKDAKIKSKKADKVEDTVTIDKVKKPSKTKKAEPISEEKEIKAETSSEVAEGEVVNE